MEKGGTRRTPRLFACSLCFRHGLAFISSYEAHTDNPFHLQLIAVKNTTAKLKCKELATGGMSSCEVYLLLE